MGAITVNCTMEQGNNDCCFHQLTNELVTLNSLDIDQKGPDPRVSGTLWVCLRKINKQTNSQPVRLRLLYCDSDVSTLSLYRITSSEHWTVRKMVCQSIEALLKTMKTVSKQPEKNDYTEIYRTLERAWMDGMMPEYQVTRAITGWDRWVCDDTGGVTEKWSRRR